MPTEQTPPAIDRKRLRSQRLREVNFQGDALRLGMNWTEDDLRKPQVLVESAYGMGHPGTFHFRGLIEEVSNGVFEAGGKPAEFVVSDICDGIVQATDGMSYSLISRDIMAAMIEIHALGHPHDAMVLISGNDGGIAILRGNIAPDAAMVKTFSVPEDMHMHIGPARVFEDESEAIDALIERKITPGDVMVIRYEGPHANGMPEMYFAAAILSSDPVLNHTTAIVTDGRYSGAMCGPCIGHVAPEALDGGPIALVEENDLIELNVPERRLAVVGIDGRHRSEDEVTEILAGRRARWSPRPPRHTRGILSLYEQISSDASHGASLLGNGASAQTHSPTTAA